MPVVVATRLLLWMTMGRGRLRSLLLSCCCCGATAVVVAVAVFAAAGNGDGALATKTDAAEAATAALAASRIILTISSFQYLFFSLSSSFFHSFSFPPAEHCKQYSFSSLPSVFIKISFYHLVVQGPYKTLLAEYSILCLLHNIFNLAFPHFF